MGRHRPGNRYLGLGVLMAWLLVAIVAASAAGQLILTSVGDKCMGICAIMVINSLSFALPALLTRRLIVGDGGWLSKPRLNASIMFGLFIIALMVQPVVEWASYVNERVCEWPSLSALLGKRSDLSAELLQEVIRFDGVGDWAVTIVVVAVLPALCEELFFRLALMPALKRISHSWHSAIVVSATIFSLLHMDAYGFFPRLILGGILGVVFYLTKSIWASFSIHLLNNLLVVVSISQSKMSTYDALTMQAENPGVMMPTLSVLIVILELYTIERITQGGTPGRQDIDQA